jgi:glycosyltransferase involved in cell wall biosynthesis
MPDQDLPSVAICIPTYNQSAYLSSAVESAFKQDYGGSVEVWIADDASTDGTGEILAQLEAVHPDLRVIRQPKNLGIAGNVSALMRAPGTDLLVRLDSDDELEKAFVRRLAEAIWAHPSAGYGHSAIVEIDVTGQPGNMRRLARSTGFQEAEAALRASLSGYRTVANVLIFRREVLELLDFYAGRPESAEDYDLAVRMADEGFGNVYVDDPLARYRVWEDEGGSRSRRKGLQLDGYIRIFSEVFEPAWQRRGWSLKPVRRRRQRLAAHHCAHCFGAQYTADERARLVDQLKDLGDGPRLRLQLRLCQVGLAGPMERAAQARGRLKSAVKAAIK